MRERRDVMARPVRPGTGTPNECRRQHSLQSGMGLCSRPPSAPAASNDCVNRPDRRLHPTKTSDHQIVLATREPPTEDLRVVKYSSCAPRSTVRIPILARRPSIKLLEVTTEVGRSFITRHCCNLAYRDSSHHFRHQPLACSLSSLVPKKLSERGST